MHIALSIDIPAPVEKVWAVAQDPDRRHLWDQRIASYRWLGPNPKTTGDEHSTENQGGSSGDPIGAGWEIAMVIRMGLLRPTARGKMMRWNPPRQSAVQIYEASSPLVPVGAGSWTFDALEGGGTRWTTRFTLKTDTLPWYVPRWLYRWAVYWDTWRSLRRLRAMVMGER